ncbi:hypothetical protein CXK94_10225 [Stutzerimonas stutzeri]|jgi:hypothetical protein|uniref:Uncharacterized protein n=1 Tax=Stutzerimonas stutzeri TaxID=316 RepID=A0A2N8T567_STUST|nr:hypothetical protein [Stutzerimonas stutzeri]MCQ4325194.1 hypothetical protein [Stutzerimonas stutzeri]PNG09907.1 hypothetical protein CXK94_10225 [Stutzerimonas stutzeri]
MSKEGLIGIALVLADGYSYTELIPFPNTPDGTPGAGFIRIFHSIFAPAEDPMPATNPIHPPLTTPEQP